MESRVRRLCVAAIGRLLFPFYSPQQVEEITLRSSLFSSEVAKLLEVVMHDVRINKDVPVGPLREPGDGEKSYDFRNRKIPPIIITFVQV